jgi:hypothetical protein
MTPINLMTELKKRIETIVADYEFQESDGGRMLRAPKVWAQHLPEKLYDDEVDRADYPFVQIVMGGGTVTEDPAENNLCNVAIMVGGYDDGIPVDKDDPTSPHDRQGWLIPAEIMWRIISDLNLNPIVGNRYKAIFPINWELPPEQPAPLWYGLINLSFTMPMPAQKFGMENWVTHPTLPNNHPYIEEIHT